MKKTLITPLIFLITLTLLNIFIPAYAVLTDLQQISLDNYNYSFIPDFTLDFDETRLIIVYGYRSSNTNFRVKVYVIDKASETVIREVTIDVAVYNSAYSAAVSKPFKYSNSEILLFTLSTSEGTSSVYSKCYIVNIDNGQVTTYSYSYTPGSNKYILSSEIYKCTANNYYYTFFTDVYGSNVYLFAVKFTGSAVTYSFYNTGESYSADNAMTVLYNGTASTNNFWVVFGKSDGTACIVKYDASANTFTKYASPLTTDWKNTRKFIFLSKRSYTIGSNVYFTLTYAYLYQQYSTIMLKCLVINDTDGLNWCTGVSISTNVQALYGGEGEYTENKISFYYLKATDWKIYNIQADINGRPLNPQFENLTDTLIAEETPYFTTNLYHGFKYSDICIYEINTNMYVIAKTKNLFPTVATYSLSVSYSPSDSPLITNTNYLFTVQTLRNNKAFSSCVLVYVDNTLYKTIDTSNGYGTFSYLTSTSGYHNFTFVIHDNQRNLDVKTETYMYLFRTRELTEEEEAMQQSIYLISLTTRILPYLFVILLPAFILAYYAGVMGFVGGLAIGVFMGVSVGLIPVYVIYLFILVMIMIVIYMMRR